MHDGSFSPRITPQKGKKFWGDFYKEGRFWGSAHPYCDHWVSSRVDRPLECLFKGDEGLSQREGGEACTLLKRRGVPGPSPVWGEPRSAA